MRKLVNFICNVSLKITFEKSIRDRNFKLVFSYFGTPGLHYDIRTHDVSSPGKLCRHFAKFIANISQRHCEHVSLGMLYGLKTCFT